MDMQNEADNRYELADVITEKPHEFTIGRKHYRLYPITLAKMFLLRGYIEGLSVNYRILSANPLLEALRIVEQHRELCCSIIAIHTTPNTYKDIYDLRAIKVRRNAFMKFGNNDLATLMVLVLSADKTEHLLNITGIADEQARLKKVMSVKKKRDKNSLTFGGLTLFGTFIAPLKELGYTDNEIIFEKGYTFLRLLLADKITTVMLTDEDRENLYIGDGGTVIDGNEPGSFKKVRELMRKNGLKFKE